MHYFESAKIFDCLVVLAMREKRKLLHINPTAATSGLTPVTRLVW